MKALVPTRTETTFEDGAFIKALDFCKKNCFSDTCQKFYSGITEKNTNQFLACPHGMSVYVGKTNGEYVYFICLRNKDAYDSKKAKKISNAPDKIVYNPLLDTEKLLELINYSAINENESTYLAEQKASIESISHEVKKLNAQIKDRSDIIVQTYGQDPDTVVSEEDIPLLLEKIKTIYVCSAMINARFALLDYEKKPQALQQGAPYDCNIYKKFHKMSIIFSNYLGRKAQIIIKGNSYRCIRAYPSFEMIPLLIVDNAVKYSNESKNITVEFHEYGKQLVVDIDSFSPYCSMDDLSKICNKGYRGKNAVRVSDGSGIGLFFAKMLCDLHGIEMIPTSDSDKITEINGVPYAPFRMRLVFPDTYEV